MKAWKIKTGLIIIILALTHGFMLVAKDHSRRNANVILITFDALRADHLGCYGYSKDTSPFLDSLSRDSLTFTNCIAQSASTVPAIAAIFTGRYPYLDGVITKDYTLGARHITIAEFLKQKGYRTFAIPGHFYVKKKFGFSRGFDYFADDYPNRLNAEQTHSRLTDLFNSRAVNNKFFLWVHIREPHAPYDAPQEYAAKFRQPSVEGTGARSGYDVRGIKTELTGRDLSRLISGYDGSIRYADDNLKKIFDYLGENGFLKNAIIIITADHGECLGERNIVNHNHLFYASLHVPLIIKARRYKAKSIAYPVSSIDIFPTVLDLLGYEKDARKLKLRGESLLKKRDIAHPQFSEYSRVHSIIKEGWHLYVDTQRNIKMLFNTRSDPQEKEDLASRHPDTCRLLYKELENILSSGQKDAAAPVDKKAILNKDDVEQLRSLGYLN